MIDLNNNNINKDYTSYEPTLFEKEGESLYMCEGLCIECGIFIFV